ncbi:sarcosine oxidase subunit gamma [Rhizobiaceae bacterium BDR2-2]|uniref:Sarcosine oxidase subunit gamma n=1 Tax=Ectorhizobium quercum TaxID=2965071 RepID=A0AAE3MXD5_9HYPH|nr:sarcosine oxidase subunit gamma family protein [Ectorhizobium quercum]MCX8996709.1 sarcosine oxidase subunit gamma [Ectorhizobium quercum]
MNFIPRHPVETALSATPSAAGVNHLSVPRSRALWSVLAHKGHEAAVGDALLAIDGVSPRFCGPQEWLAVAAGEDAGRVANALSAIAGASIAEQSGGRTVLTLSGPDVRTLLAKCTAVDLHPSAFAVGRSANALVCHVGGNVARLSADTYELIVMRSFALSVFEELRLMGREFALTASFAD